MMMMMSIGDVIFPTDLDLSLHPILRPSNKFLPAWVVVQVLADMTCNVFSGALNLLNQSLLAAYSVW